MSIGSWLPAEHPRYPPLLQRTFKALILCPRGLAVVSGLQHSLETLVPSHSERGGGGGGEAWLGTSRMLTVGREQHWTILLSSNEPMRLLLLLTPLCE